MTGRGGVRSSARLSADSAAATAAAPVAQELAAARGRPSSNATSAAVRRARAAERALEVEDSPRVLRHKCRLLARALKNAKHLVVYTGAGISTAADIPDYRGPQGVWTRLRRGERVPRAELATARPTYTHMALAALWARGTLKFVASQNCDGLHLRAGLPRRALAELHGDMLVELCARCRAAYLRAFDTTQRTARHRHATRRLCHACGAELRDSIVHFGERGRAAWPLNWAGALRHAARADVVLCLGSSLKVLRRYPRLWRMERAPRHRPALYIVNLQWTPKDAVAALKINARCDAVMAQVARRLRLRVPSYRARRDPVLAHAEPLAPPEAHTTRRAPLARSPPPPSSASSSASSSTSTASDSDEEVPLCRLADRLRADLRAFTVNLQSGEATVLLRAQHAPSAPPAVLPPPAPPRRAPPCTADLRSFRMVRPRPLNGFTAPPSPLDASKPPPANGVAGLGSRLRRLLEYEPRIAAGEGAKVPPRAGFEVASRPDVKPELKYEPKVEPKLELKEELKEEAKGEASSSDEGAGGARAARALAAAIIRRAVLLCRASLYPGLHTIISPGGPPPAPPPPAPADCAWCARHFAARRCLWYGAPRNTPLARRAWRAVRGRRYLCACCGRADGRAASPPREADDDGGWYGKGYRKGRRRAR